MASRVRQQIVLLHQLFGDERYSLPRVLNGRRVPKIYCANAPIAVYAAGNVFDLDRDDIFKPSPVLEFCKGDTLQNMLGNAFLDHDLTPKFKLPARSPPSGLSSKTTLKHFRSSVENRTVSGTVFGVSMSDWPAAREAGTVSDNACIIDG
jgi:hypothetical protein